jgi:hypothetical protein
MLERPAGAQRIGERSISGWGRIAKSKKENLMDNQRKILEMLADKKISVDEAERLMSLLKTESETRAGDTKKTILPLKYLRVEVTPGPQSTPNENQKVNIRVPMSLIKAGMKLAYVMPPGVYDQVESALKEKGIQMDLRNLRPEDLEELLSSINDIQIDVQNEKQTVRVYAE